MDEIVKNCITLLQAMIYEDQLSDILRKAVMAEMSSDNQHGQNKEEERKELEASNIISAFWECISSKKYV